MREEDSNWFCKWEEELPSPEELTPISQTLITRDLALAFDIQTPNPHSNFSSPSQFHHHIHHRSSQIPVTPPPPVPTHLQNSGDFDSSSAELGGGGSGGGGIDEPARTLKRPRLVWTPQLHKRFVDAVAHLGIKNAVPKTIMQLMSVDGLTRENVASHLQKYRLYLKRMQGINNGGGAAVSGGGSGDTATDHLFASSPVPPHLLSGGGGVGGGRTNTEHFMGYVSPAALHQQQVAAMVAGGQYHHHLHNRQIGHFGSPANGGGGGQFEHSFLARQAQMARQVQNSGHGYVEDVELGTPANGHVGKSLGRSEENRSIFDREDQKRIINLTSHPGLSSDL